MGPTVSSPDPALKLTETLTREERRRLHELSGASTPSGSAFYEAKARGTRTKSAFLQYAKETRKMPSRIKFTGNTEISWACVLARAGCGYGKGLISLLRFIPAPWGVHLEPTIPRPESNDSPASRPGLGATTEAVFSPHAARGRQTGLDRPVHHSSREGQSAFRPTAVADA